jgi:hypothetical protein
MNTDGPQCGLSVPTRRRVGERRGSVATAPTEVMENCGSERSQVRRSALRARNSPLRVPISMTVSAMVTTPSWTR